MEGQWKGGGQEEAGGSSVARRQRTQRKTEGGGGLGEKAGERQRQTGRKLFCPKYKRQRGQLKVYYLKQKHYSDRFFRVYTAGSSRS